MSEKWRPSRRDIGKGVLAILGLGGETSETDAAEKKKNQKNAPKEIDTQKRAEIFAYMRKLNGTKIFSSGTAEEMIHLCRNASIGGERPDIPALDQETGREWRPSFSYEYKGERDRSGWSALRFLSRGHQGLFAELGIKSPASDETLVRNALRVDTDRVLVPTVHGRLSKLSNGVNAEVLSIPLRDEHRNAPVNPLLPEVRDETIKDGTYAVALGTTGVGYEGTNVSEKSGRYYLTGFLCKIKGQDALRKLLETAARKNIPDAKELNQYMRTVDNSYLMIGDMFEWSDLLSRIASGDDGTGQSVYVSTSNAGFQRMGMLHHMMYLVKEGDTVRLITDSSGRIHPEPGQLFAPVYLVHGRTALETVAGK